MKRTLIALALAGALGGCQTVTQTVTGWYDDIFSSGSKKTLPAPLVDFKPSAEVKLRASANIGGAGGFVFAPVLNKEGLFATGFDGKLARFEADTLKERWRTEVGKKLSGGVGAAENLVVAGTQKGEVLAFDFNGQPLWQARVTSEVLSPPQIAGGLVLVRSGDGRIFALDAKDGKRKWLYQRATPALTVRSFGGLMIDKNGVFAGFGGGKLVALDLESGNVGWEVSVALPRGVSELERIADVTSNAVTDGRLVCAVAFQGRVACFEIQNGNVAWARDLSSIAGLAMDARNVYVADVKGAVHAMDKTTGAYVWKQDKLTHRQLSTPLIYRGYVVVGDLQGYVHFISREDGAFAARIATDGSPIRAQPQALTNGVLVQTKSGGLFVLGLS
jgi:outer membrane protein assembly factor BamB